MNEALIQDEGQTLIVVQRRVSGGIWITQARSRIGLSESEVGKLISFAATGSATPPKARLITYPVTHADTE
jgi:hypothetical protein